MANKQDDLEVQDTPFSGVSPPEPNEKMDLRNASGHVQELDRNFNVFSIAALGIGTDNAWAAGGGSLVVALYNGGGPGVLYGLLVAFVFYLIITAGLAELASAMPSSANVYHWASITGGPRHGRLCSWFAGWWNMLGWIFGTASSCAWSGNSIVAMYNLYHPDYSPQRYQIFICFLVILWVDCAIVLFAQRFVGKLAAGIGTLCLICAFISLMVCAIMPSQTGAGYASNYFVWGEWQNFTGWSSNGLVFLMGLQNGAFAIGTPDIVTHMSEEIANPKRNIPKGMLAQLIISTVTTFVFYISILYCITSLDDVINSNITSLPLAAIYQQATRSNAGTFGLLFIFLLNAFITIPGGLLASGRQIWILARDDVLPFASIIRKVHPRWENPFNAQLLVAVLITILGAIYVGTITVFNALVGCFCIFTTLSFLAALLPNLLTRRRYVKPGPFWMPSPIGPIILTIACAYIIAFDVIYMFPYSMPVDAKNMNWNCVISGGLTIFVGLWYLWKRNHGYVGPKVLFDGRDDLMVGVNKILKTT